MLMKKLIPALALAGAAFAPLASAQTTTPYYAPWQGDFWGRGYIGASAGESKFDSECDRLIVTECDKKDTGFKIYAGGKFSPIFGLELGYTDFGSIRASGGETDAWAIPLTLTAGVPLGDRFELFGKLGGLYGQTDVEVAPTSLFERGHKSGWGWTYGVGATFAFTKAVQLRVDWDRYELDFASGRRDVDMMSAGLQVRF
jgi:OOP family OmpA-OmpF porin